MKYRFLIILTFFALQMIAQSTSRIGLFLIPTPKKTEITNGTFSLDNKVFINVKGDNAVLLKKQIKEAIREMTSLDIGDKAIPGGKLIRLEKWAKGTPNPDFSKSSLDSLVAHNEEGYLLKVQSNQVVITAITDAGLFYGAQTFVQLIQGNTNESNIPCVTIADWPTLRYRGWMDDISRGPIPNMAYLKEVIRTLAGYKLNYFTLYTEHVFKLKTYPDLAPQDGITPEQIAELETYAKDYHIEVIGNQQAFGHAEHTLEIPYYRQLAENENVLSPGNEKTYEFLKNVFSEVAPAYKSKFFNINCDEVSGLGEGPAKAMVNSKGKGGTYAYHINRINDLLKPYGKRLMMWGDVAVSSPEIIAQLPKDIIVLSWGYGAEPSYDKELLPFQKSGFDFMVAPGVSCWGQIWPNMSNAVVNIANYVRDGARLGAMGMMNTCWSDNGETLFNANWHGLIWGAEMAWSPTTQIQQNSANVELNTRLTQFNQGMDHLFFGTDLPVMESLFQFDTIRKLPIRHTLEDASMWSGLTSFTPIMSDPDYKKKNHSMVEQANSLQTQLSFFLENVTRHRDVLDNALFAARKVGFVGRKNVFQIKLYLHYLEGAVQNEAAKYDAGVLLDSIQSLKMDEIRFWERENRSWWRDKVTAKYDQLADQLIRFDQLVFIEPENKVNNGQRLVRLRTLWKNRPIYYTLDGSVPTRNSDVYNNPISITNTTSLKASVCETNFPGKISEMNIGVHKGIGKILKRNTQFSNYNPAYDGGGDQGLADGLSGSTDFADGRWQGYEGADLDVVYDFGEATNIQKIGIRFLQNAYTWILMPQKVSFLTSEDGVNFQLVKEIPNPVDPKEEGTILHTFSADNLGLKTRYLRVIGKSPGALPAWHHAAGYDAYIFADEIKIE